MVAGPKLAQEFEPGSVRQPHVEQHQVGWLAGETVARPGDVEGQLAFHATLAQLLADRASEQLLVVDDEHRGNDTPRRAR